MSRWSNRPPEDQAVLVHRQFDFLPLNRVEGDRQVIARRDEPIPAFGLEERGKARRVIAVGTPGGALILVDLASGERRTIDWFDPIAALAIGPYNHIAIGDGKGYTVIRVP